MAKELDKVYDPKQVEDRTYRYWMDGGYFHARPNPEKESYTIVMPPPNITGQLHMGHALDDTLQDVLIRWRRMQGYEALWMPGTDHASIATEARITETLREEGIEKEALGREGFLERAWAWKEEYGGRIINQIKKLGCSCDWDRLRFTMDEGCSKAVREVFCNLYEKGIIYRGERIINWCPHCLTSISDAEVEHEEKDGNFWHIRYPLTDGSGYIEVATTRPETMLGDTAVAVHPEDKRYASMIGKTLTLPLMNRDIPVVADNYVDREFGTGAVKITPAHDPNDFEVGLRHDLPIINVMNPDATMNENAGKYQGMTTGEARKTVVSDLREQGFLVEIKEHRHSVGTCYRCSRVVEPRVSKQWFVKMEPLAKGAIQAVRDGETKFVPERFEKIYFHWMENIRDWCISRQLWWGHQIPAWYCGKCGEITVARETPEACRHCGSHDLSQDPDTLDTWFSSALWPFSTLGWPDKTPELDYFYPTSTLVTAYDIIFFWVARMIFSGVCQMGKSPFDTVFIHGIIRDAEGRKMSKSLGNGIDPLAVIDEYGADALRFTLVTGNSPGNDMRFSDEKVRSSRNFANKIWNATRFALMNIDPSLSEAALPKELSIEDQWVLSKYSRVVREVTDNLERFEIGMASAKLYDFIWDVLCDWYIELLKTRFQAGGETAARAGRVLAYVMGGTYRMLHPFMPFITEEVWRALPHTSGSIMVADWPVYDPALSFEKEEAAFEKIMAAIKAIRNRRAEMNVPPGRKAAVRIETPEEAVFSKGVPFIQKLASASQVEIGPSFDPEGSVQIISDGARILIPMEELIDLGQEKARLQKEFESVKKEIAMLEGKLSNSQFTAKAPPAIVEGEKAKLEKAKERLLKIQESMDRL